MRPAPLRLATCSSAATRCWPDLRAIPDVAATRRSQSRNSTMLPSKRTGEPTDLIQTKHHIGKTGNLTDASVDLWKTLVIWSKRVAKT